MRWPWQSSAPVEHRSSYTDQVVSALVQHASGGGDRTAVQTAAVQQCAVWYGSALASCTLSAPPSVVGAFDATWRESIASNLIRSGQVVYLIGASPDTGLSLQPISHWDVMGGPSVSSWRYRVEQAGPTSSTWRTVPAAAVLHVRWSTNPARPVGGCQSVTACGRLWRTGWRSRAAAVRGGERAGRRVSANRKIRRPRWRPS